MTYALTVSARLGLVLALAAGGCTELADGDEALSETTQDLLVSDWTAITPPTITTWHTPQDPQVATINGTTLIVYRIDTDLYWQKRTSTGWSDAEEIVNHHTQDAVRLAAFNGFLYMVHAGETDRSEVWLSRFDPATETWSEDTRLSYVGFNGPPAIAAFDNKLFFVGSLKQSLLTVTYPMWVATMTIGETFSSSQRLAAAHESANPPSLAVYGGKLWVAHRNGQTGDIVVNTHNAGAAATSWSSPALIPAASLGAPIRGVSPSIAAVNGFLHLVHTQPSPATEYVWWTYFDGCSWAPEQTIHQLTTLHRPSLTAGGAGLILATTVSGYYLRITEFHAPPPPIVAPPCTVVGP